MKLLAMSLALALVGCGGRSQLSEPGPAAGEGGTGGAGLGNVLGDLDGLRWELPCTGTTTSSTACTTVAVVEASTTVEGKPGTSYEVTMRIRGVVEEKTYEGGVREGYFHVGGEPDGGAWNVYRLQVSDPPGTYYLNSGESRLYSCEAIDYRATVIMDAGATVSMTADSVEGAEIINRDESGEPIVVADIPPYPAPYDGQFVQMDVLSIVARP